MPEICRINKKLLAFLVLLAGAAVAQQPAQPPPQAPAQPENGRRVLEEIIARVNNEIITTSELARSREALRQELAQECQGCTEAEVNAKLAEREKDLLRDLIDNSLLVQRAKDMGVNVEPEVIRRLDAIRVQNNLPDMEALESAVIRQGIPWEEFKASIRNRLLTEAVIRNEVGREMSFTTEEKTQFYEENKKEFHRPEQVVLEEIFVSTANKSQEEVTQLEQRANLLLERVRRGEDFNELAKRYSDGSTAKDGGQLGVFQRGQLAKELEDVVFAMGRSEVTNVMTTRTGYLILRVVEKYDEGIQPLEKVENEIMNALYFRKLQPTLRKYLTRLREESYVMVKTGYTDTAAVSSQPIVEVTPSEDNGKGKKDDKKKKKSSGE